ncbi:MAG: GNAT family N-acetyltransferase [Capsulimonadales bacterium]|nr:GNAT family N-acetyltransferase [Capsulimonadales bacterium]
MPAINIRPFASDDYPALAAIGNACFPEFADIPESLRHRDSARPAHTRWNHFLAEIDGVPVGMASYTQRESMYHPRKFDIDVIVLPERQRQGIGSALYDHLTEQLRPFDPILIRAFAQEGRMYGPEFLQRRGFVEAMRNWESRLRLADFDPEAYTDAIARVTAQGIVIRPLSELRSQPDWERKMFEMDWAISLDMPATDVRTKPTFESWRKRTLDDPDFLPEGWFIALDGDRFIGESAIWNSQLTNDLFVGSTGVLREYRRRGIAMALKVYATAFARERGAVELKTWNAQSNRAMLSINEAMGFVKQPPWIEFEKKTGDE